MICQKDKGTKYKRPWNKESPITKPANIQTIKILRSLVIGTQTVYKTDKDVQLATMVQIVEN